MPKEKKPNIEELHNTGNYRLVKSINHNDIAHFVLQQLKQLRWPMLLFYAIILSLLLMILGFSLYNFFNPLISWESYGLYMLYGIITGMLLVIPFHEALHGLAYKFAGARKIQYGMDVKQMLFYASAPGFVTDKQAFLIVAYFPFIIINLFFASGIVFGHPDLKWASLVAIFIHSSLCVGDFAMMNFLASFPNSILYTYDDQSNKISYFFIRSS